MDGKHSTKRKGGAERERDKNKKLLLGVGKKCQKINTYFQFRANAKNPADDDC